VGWHGDYPTAINQKTPSLLDMGEALERKDVESFCKDVESPFEDVESTGKVVESNTQ
jgi:hypothetical protein